MQERGQRGLEREVTMLVRKCNTEEAELLPDADKMKLLAIVTLDSLQEPEHIKQALATVNKLLEKEQKHKK